MSSNYITLPQVHDYLEYNKLRINIITLKSHYLQVPADYFYIVPLSPGQYRSTAEENDLYGVLLGWSTAEENELYGVLLGWSTAEENYLYGVLLG